MLNKTKINTIYNFALLQFLAADEVCSSYSAEVDKDRQYWVARGAYLQTKRIMEVIEKLTSDGNTIDDVLKFIKRRYDMEL